MTGEAFRAAAYGHIFVTPETGPAVVRVDHRLMEIAINNRQENALEHSPAGTVGGGRIVGRFSAWMPGLRAVAE